MNIISFRKRCACFILSKLLHIFSIMEIIMKNIIAFKKIVNDLFGRNRDENYFLQETLCMFYFVQIVAHILYYINHYEEYYCL